MGYVRRESNSPGTILQWREGTATVAKFPEESTESAANG